VSSAFDCYRVLLWFYSFGALIISRKLDGNEIFIAQNNSCLSKGNNYFLDILCFLKLFQSFTINSRYKTKLQTLEIWFLEHYTEYFKPLMCGVPKTQLMTDTPRHNILNALTIIDETSYLFHHLVNICKCFVFHVYILLFSNTERHHMLHQIISKVSSYNGNDFCCFSFLMSEELFW